MSKQLTRLREKHPDKIHDAYVDQDGAWIEFNPGWTNPTTGCHAIHEDTVREALAAWKWTERCECEWCVSMTATEFEATLGGIGWSRAELAVRLGVSERSVRYWLSGEHPVPASVAGWLRGVETAVLAMAPPARPGGDGVGRRRWE